MLFGPEHVDRYVATDGAEGHDWQGTSILVLTTTGRKSGEPRTSALIYAKDGDDYLVIASMGGAPKHPQWYLNITANPEAEIQVKSERVRVTARTAASGAERDRLWKVMAGPWPNYDTYQARTDREIPVVVLTPR